MFLRVNNQTQEAGMFGDMADTARVSGCYERRMPQRREYQHRYAAMRDLSK